MGRRHSKHSGSAAALRAENAKLRAALTGAQGMAEPSPAEMAEIDLKFKRALRQQIRLMQAKDQEAKQLALLKMTDFAP